VRRVAVGEASQFDGVLHKGLPLRVLNNKNNNLILKDEDSGFYNIGQRDMSLRNKTDIYGNPIDEGEEGEEGEESEGNEIIDAVKGILEDAYSDLDELAGNTAVIPGRAGPEAAGPAMDAMEKLRSMIDMLED